MWSPDGRYLYVLATNRAGCLNDLSLDDTAMLRFDINENGSIARAEQLTPDQTGSDFPARVSILDFALSPDGKGLFVAAVPPDRPQGHDLWFLGLNANEIVAHARGQDAQATVFEAMVRLTDRATGDIDALQALGVR